MKSSLNYLKKLELFKELDNFKEGEFFAIADQKVKNHLPQWILFSSRVFWLREPEAEKNLETYERALDFFLRQGISRNSVLYAIGGGATTDFAGFVASTILRGIKWVSVPTTLLAMIDGSLGGKVAVNMPLGKNLVGAFHMPDQVLVCSDFLNSLPEKEWMSGKGEILKYGFLSSEIHELIINKAPIEEIIIACAKFKIDIVEKDFKENGDRILLNLGHTLGHAFEHCLKIPHGHAVAMGLKYLFKLTKNEYALNAWEKMVKSLSLPQEKFEISHFPRFDLQKFVSFIEQDKKKIDKKLRLIVVKEIGRCSVEEVLLKDFKTRIMEYADFQN